MVQKMMSVMVDKRLISSPIFLLLLLFPTFFQLSKSFIASRAVKKMDDRHYIEIGKGETNFSKDLTSHSLAWGAPLEQATMAQGNELFVEPSSLM